MRQFRRPVKVILFLSSYVPLFFIMAIKLWNTGLILISVNCLPIINASVRLSALSLLLVVFCTVLTFLLYKIIGVHSNRGTTQRPIDQYQKRNDLLMTYLLVYIFTFAGLDFEKLLDLVIFLIFFVMLGVLQIRSGHLYINPMLGVRGYEVYEITSGDEVLLVISNGSIKGKITPAYSDDPEARDKVDVVELDKTTFFAP